MRYVLFAFTAPWSVIVGWGWVALMFCLGAAKELRWEPTLVLTAEWRPWAAKLWGFSTTLGRGIVYWPGTRAGKNEPWTPTQAHEHVHVNQVEDQMVLSFILGLILFFVLGGSTDIWDTAGAVGFFVWFSGGAWQLPNYLTALLRHLGYAERPKGVGFLKFVVFEIMYRRSEHERSAYAQTDPWGPHHESWINRNA